MTPAARSLAGALLIQMECGGNLDRYLHAYQDGGGTWTLGVGSTFMPSGRRVTRGDAVTHAEALALLEHQIDAWAAVITRAVTVPLSDPWTAVLVSFVHQFGPGNLPGSVLADMLNAGLLLRAGRQLNGWVIASGKPNLGIMRRQEAQRRIAGGDPLLPTVKAVWMIGDAALLPLYQAACSDALRYRNGVATWTVHPAAHEPVALHVAASETDALNAAELTKTETT